jgi:hypothetical protein
MLFECIMSQDNYHMQLKCIEPISKRELVYRNISQIVTITRHTNHKFFSILWHHLQFERINFFFT